MTAADILLQIHTMAKLSLYDCRSCSHNRVKLSTAPGPGPGRRFVVAHLGEATFAHAGKAKEWTVQACSSPGTLVDTLIKDSPCLTVAERILGFSYGGRVGWSSSPARLWQPADRSLGEVVARTDKATSRCS